MTAAQALKEMRSYTAWQSTLPACLNAIEAELRANQETITRLNRRCQAAEAAANEKIEGHDPSFGRALANYAAADAMRKLEARDEEIARLTEKLKSYASHSREIDP